MQFISQHSQINIADIMQWLPTSRGVRSGYYVVSSIKSSKPHIYKYFIGL